MKMNALRELEAAVASLKHSIPHSKITWVVEPKWGVLLEGNQVTARALVKPDGLIDLPYVGEVRVSGLSTTEVDTLLARLYARVYVNARITTAVTDKQARPKPCSRARPIWCCASRIRPPPEEVPAQRSRRTHTAPRDQRCSAEL